MFFSFVSMCPVPREILSGILGPWLCQFRTFSINGTVLFVVLCDWSLFEVSEVYAGGSMYKNSIPLYGWVILRCVCVSHFIHLSPFLSLSSDNGEWPRSLHMLSACCTVELYHQSTLHLLMTITTTSNHVSVKIHVQALVWVCLYTAKSRVTRSDQVVMRSWIRGGMAWLLSLASSLPWAYNVLLSLSPAQSFPSCGTSLQC